MARWLSYTPLDSYGFWRRLIIGKTELSLRLDHPGFQLIADRAGWHGAQLSIELRRQPRSRR
jgi:hypothetical protein